MRLIALENSLNHLTAELPQKFSVQTNSLFSLSIQNRFLKRLADTLNRELIALRKQKLALQAGNAELKNAVVGIAHDLRTPLTAISGYLELLESEEKSENVTRYTAIIRERTEALRVLAEELFAYSAVASVSEKLELQKLSLRGELEVALAAAYGALQSKKIQTEINLTEKEIFRFLDKNALQRIFGNILSNVLKYSAGDLKVEMTDEGEMIFSNRASGLDSIKTGRLFDRFYTVESGQSSTGLGLSIAKLLTEKMGGEIGAVYLENRLEIHLSFPET